MENNAKYLDWPTVLFYGALVLIGWLNIYAAIYDPEIDQSIFGFTSNKAGSQFLWIIVAIVIIVCIINLDFKFYFDIAYIFYGIAVLMLIGVLVVGVEVNGSKSWFDLKLFKIQPSEFGKVASALAIARYIDKTNVKYKLEKETYFLIALIAIPALLILLQPDTGSFLVFASFLIVMYLDGLPSWIPAIGLIALSLFIITLFVNQWYLISALGVIALIILALIRSTFKNVALVLSVLAVAAVVIFSTNFFIHNVLKEHQQKRIQVLIDPEVDPKGAGWNIIQSKIAIGSGGLLGKGYMKGNVTKFDFVPEQHTDFIFCTIGEEHGWVGTSVVIGLYVGLLLRLMVVVNRQKSKFARVYGYSVVSILFFHFMVNIGMTIGLFPVIGIPLPFLSYGGSSLWAFTILVFVFLKLDMHRTQILSRF